ncbi:hypothetical protein MMC31_005474, partial [Peltigera leucophlebia]|nr:hypothetical protein [Peltigera leucophlebia]
SGGFVSDLTFFGGNIGFRAGSQQFTARNLKFVSCLTAISMIWDWGFTGKKINVLSRYIARDCTWANGADGQGTGPISVLDGPRPNVVLDNLMVENSTSVVLVSSSETILPESPPWWLSQLLAQFILGLTRGKERKVQDPPAALPSWAMGRCYTLLNGTGSYVTGSLNPVPLKSPKLEDNSDKFFERSKPQCETKTASSFIIATKHGVNGRRTRCQTNAINLLLQSAAGAPVFFPAGVYFVEGTIHIPVGSIIVGEGWSWGPDHFSQMNETLKSWSKLATKATLAASRSQTCFSTVKGATVGAILVEWNIHECSQGSEASSPNPKAQHSSTAPHPSTTFSTNSKSPRQRTFTLATCRPKLHTSNPPLLLHRNPSPPPFQTTPRLPTAPPPPHHAGKAGPCVSSNQQIYSSTAQGYTSSGKITTKPAENCQKRLEEIDSSSDDSSQGLWVYNIFTKGAEKIISPAAANTGGFTSEISAWLPLALSHADNTSSLAPTTASATAPSGTPLMRFRRF